MKALLIPAVMAFAGTGAGVGAGLFLGPEPAAPDAPAEDIAETSEPATEAPAEDLEYAKLANQFVVPVIANERIAAMVVISVSIAVPTGQKDAVFAVEPKLRDGLLQAMFNHANIGGFSGNFTSTSNMRSLRADLLQSARAVMGASVQDVLIIDIVRQDV